MSSEILSVAEWLGRNTRTNYALGANLRDNEAAQGKKYLGRDVHVKDALKTCRWRSFNSLKIDPSIRTLLQRDFEEGWSRQVHQLPDEFSRRTRAQRATASVGSRPAKPTKIEDPISRNRTGRDCAGCSCGRSIATAPANCQTALNATIQYPQHPSSD